MPRDLAHFRSALISRHPAAAASVEDEELRAAIVECRELHPDLGEHAFVELVASAAAASLCAADIDTVEVFGL